MASSAAQICNLALNRVGHQAFIDDLADASAEGVACELLYPLSRDALLASFPWSFARRRAELAVIADAARDGWSYVFALPADCVTAGPIWNGMTPPVGSYPDTRTYEQYAWQGVWLNNQVPYTTEDDVDAGRVLLANQSADSLSYISSSVAVSRYPALFVQALAWHLAAELALGFAKKPELAVRAMQRYEQEKGRAAAAEMQQQQEAPLPDAGSILARG